MRYFFASCILLMMVGCSPSNGEPAASTSPTEARSFEPFPRAVTEEVGCSIWRQGEDGKSIFRSEGGPDKHVATAYFNGETLTLRSDQSATYGFVSPIIYTIDDHPARQVRLETNESEFGTFEGTIAMQGRVSGDFETLGVPVAIKGMCAG